MEEERPRLPVSSFGPVLNKRRPAKKECSMPKKTEVSLSVIMKVTVNHLHLISSFSFTRMVHRKGCSTNMVTLHFWMPPTRRLNTAFLFMLVVRTNVSYLTAAAFICEVETAESIKEALQMISTWNPEWTPSHWMVDYSDAEYQAIQHVFPRAQIYLCTSHREQGWMRLVRGGRFTFVRWKI